MLETTTLPAPAGVITCPDRGITLRVVKGDSAGTASGVAAGSGMGQEMD